MEVRVPMPRSTAGWLEGRLVATPLHPRTNRRAFFALARDLEGAPDSGVSPAPIGAASSSARDPGAPEALPSGWLDMVRACARTARAEALHCAPRGLVYCKYGPV